MILNPGQLTMLRDDYPHVAQAYISAMIPSQVYCGRISVAPTRGDSTITVANESGNIANVVADQQVLVSSTVCGGRDKSVRRLRSRAGQDLTLDANGVDWATGDYITVMENWEPRQRFPEILNTSPYTMYKDEDVVYSDGNLEPFPVAIMGPPWAGFLDGATVVVQLDGSDSYAIAPGATISSYLWATSGGALANANVSTTYITFNVVGTYWVSLTVTDSNGKTQITRRPFFVHDRGDNAPYSGFSANIRMVQGSGVVLSVQSLDDADTWPLGTMVVTWMEEQFNTVPSSIGGYADREHIKFDGYLADQDSISIDPEQVGELSLVALSPDQLLSKMKMWSIALLDVNRDPISWYEYKNLTVARAIHHLWRWHSTLFSITDVWLPTANTLRKGSADFPEGNLLSQAKQLASEKGIFASIGCNKQGAVYVEVDPLMISEADRAAIDTVQEITLEDWVDNIGIIYRERGELPLATLSGVLWDGATGTPFASIMPGVVPELDGDRGADEQFQMLASQADCNEKAGLLYARANNDIKEVRVRRFAGNYTHVDVYPQELYTLTVTAEDNKRGISIDARDLIPRSVNINIDPSRSIAIVDAVFEATTVDVVDGIPLDYPISVPTTPPQPAAPASPEPEEDSDGAAIVAFTLGDGVYLSKNAGTSWATRNGARVGADLNDRGGLWDPWGPNRIKHASYDPEKAILISCGVGYIKRSLDAGRNWYDVTPGDPPNAWGDSPAPTASDLTYEMGVSDWHVNKQHYVIAWYQNAASEYRGYLLHTDDDMASWTHYAMGSDNPTVATWTFPEVAITTENMWCDRTGTGNPTRTLSNPQNIGADDGASGGPRITFTARADNDELFQTALILDFGGWFRLDAGTVDGGDNFEAQLTVSSDTMTITDVTVMDLLVELGRLYKVQCDSDRQAFLLWDGAVDGYPVAALPSTKNDDPSIGDYVRYAMIDIGAPAAARYRGSGNWQHLFDYIKVYPSHVNNEVRPTAIDIDRENGRFLYVSTWEGEGIRTRVYDTNNSLTFPAAILWVDEVTRAEFEARDFFLGVKSLYDVAQADYGDWFCSFGRWQNGNPSHITAFTIDNARFLDGKTLDDDASWLASEWLGAIVWLTKDRIVAALNRGSADPELWETTDFGVNWTLLSEIPFTSAFDNGVEFAMDMHGGDDLTIVAGDFNGEEIFKQDSPWTGAWTDVTPAGAAATRVGSVLWVYNRIP